VHVCGGEGDCSCGSVLPYAYFFIRKLDVAQVKVCNRIRGCSFNRCACGARARVCVCVCVCVSF